ncbi:MAG: hypothetical protein M1813_005370 [Trichoglossum hirsutum]|nr:MAG: hypothetical protein M1813_005370 [Trichoglossum hirsutum]
MATSASLVYAFKSVSSTPAKSPFVGNSNSTATDRASSLLNTIASAQKVWMEEPSLEPQMMSNLLDSMEENWIAFANTTLRQMPELAAFVETVGKGSKNENEFADLVSAIESRVATRKGKRDVQYVQSGANPMLPRMKALAYIEGYGSQQNPGLKPDFFTCNSSTRVLGLLRTLNPHTSELEPGVDTTSRKRRRSTHLRNNQEEGSTSDPGSASADTSSPVTRNEGFYNWEDVSVLWEVKNTREPNLDKRKEWGNLILKATEVLRYQWHRTFVLGFMVCGKQMRMFWFSRSYVLISQLTDIQGEQNTSVLVRCILACLVLRHTKLGFSDHDTLTIEHVEGEFQPVVVIDEKKFILGKQIIWPIGDYLIGRATTVHLARTLEDEKSQWRYCYKSSWPYAVREHEGKVLEELQGVPGIVRLFAWDEPSSNQVDWITENCNFTSSSISKDYSRHSSRPGTSGNSRSRSCPGTDDEAPSFWGHTRRHRQTVTEYVPKSFSNYRDLDLPDLLSAWHSLYDVINRVAAKGWVHRDLSWNNVRIQRGANGSCSVVLIDFDLAAKIVGEASGAPDKTGTPAFMPLEILDSDELPVRHQELHEDEAALWVGMLALLARSASTDGSKLLKCLLDPSSGLELIRLQKVVVALKICQANQAESWFRGPAAAESAEAREWDLVQKTCSQLVSFQFQQMPGDMLNYTYSTGENLHDSSDRYHQVQHNAMFEKVAKILTNAIDEFDSIRKSAS